MTYSSALRAVSSYRQTEAQSRTPLELVAMLYDGTLQSLAEARAAIERRDIPQRRQAVSRALSIISQLQSTLDMEAGGEIARSLDQLYSFASGRIMDASFKQDVRPLDDVIKVLTTLRDAWADIARTPPAAGTQAAR